jgi:hypothetical protein
VLALSALPAMAADQDVRIVRLSLAAGDVQIDRNTGVGWEPAINNMPLPSGTRIRAAEDSRAVIELEDGSSIGLDGPAQVALQLYQSVDGTPVDRLEIDSGVVDIHAVLAARADFRIRDKSGSSFVVTQPSRLQFKVGEKTASLAVMEGEVEAWNAGGYSLTRGGESYYYRQPEPAAQRSK